VSQLAHAVTDLAVSEQQQQPRVIALFDAFARPVGKESVPMQLAQ